MVRGLVWLAAVAATGVGARAQEALFLEPASAVVARGEQIELTASAAGVARAWPAERIHHFFARTAWTQENRDTLAGDGEDGLTAGWTAELPGVMVLGCDLSPRVEVVTASSFSAFVGRVLPSSRRAAFGALPAAGEVSVRRVESAKALVRVEAAGEQPVSIATSKTGQAVEIRPLMDPTALAPGGDLLLKIYAAIPGPAAGVVLATNTTTGESLSVETDDSASANLTIPSAGRWRVEFHAVMPIEDEDAQWLIHTATLTFDVVGDPAGGASHETGEVTK
jgi:hypothetical protein